MWTEESWAEEAEAEFVFEIGRRGRGAPRSARRPRRPLPRPLPRPFPKRRPRRPPRWFGGGPAWPPREEPPGPCPDPSSVDLDDPAALRALQAALDRVFDQLVRRARAR